MTKKALWLGAVCLLVLHAAPGAAETLGGEFLDSDIPFDVSRGQNVSVLERPRPEYEAIGIRQGGFLLYPTLKTGLGYSNNVYGQTNNKIGDGYVGIDPNLHVESDWSRNQIQFDGGAALRRFFNQTAKNEDGFHADLNGRLDIGDSNISAEGRIVRAYEAQYSGSFPVNAAGSIQYTTKTGKITGAYQGARFTLLGSADINRLTFKDVRAFDGSIIDERSRDETIARGSGRLEFAASPTSSAFVQMTYSNANYDSQQALGNVDNRDSHEYRVLAGATFDLAQLVRGSVGVGYVKRNYDSPVFGSLGGLTFDVRFQYFVTQLTNISITANRIVQDSITPNSGGYFATSVIGRVDHELLRNLLLNVEGGYERDKFDQITRRDSTYRVSGGADYFLNRWIGLNGSVSYLDRKSDGAPAGVTFDEFRSVLSLTFQI